MYIYMKCFLEIKSLVPTPSWQWQLDFQRERKEELQVYLINITIYSVCVNKKNPCILLLSMVPLNTW